MTTLVAAREGPVAIGMPTSGLVLIVGHPKSGKTTFAASFPDSYVLELEKNGADRVPGRARIHEINGLQEFGDVLELVMAEPSIQTVIIDSVDQLTKWLGEEIAKNAGAEFLGQTVKGVDNFALWAEFAQNVSAMTDMLKSSGKLVIMIAHCKSPEKDREGRVITPAGINVSGKGGQYIAAQAEVIGYMKVKELNGKPYHYLSFKAESDLAIWRSRIDELHGQEILLDKANPFGSFAGAFDRKPAVAVSPALVAANGNGHKTPAKTATKRR